MSDVTFLQGLWFVLISVLWLGYFVLEGFDFGVGMLLRAVGRTDSERRAVIHSIGPVWDGNEVWLLVAGGATFAAFPQWYATLFSGFYLALFLILVALIVRGVAFEFWGKRSDAKWRTGWEWALIAGSFLPALLWGVGWANIVSGVPIGSDGEFSGTLFDLLNPYALFGGLATLSIFLAHGANFLALKTKGGAGNAVAGHRNPRDPRRRRDHRRLPHLDADSPVRPRWHRGRVGDPRGRFGGRPGRRCRLLEDEQHPRVHGQLRRHRRPVHVAVRRPLPERDGLEHQRGQQPDAGGGLLVSLHAHRDDGGRRGAGAARAPLPGLDLLGLPPPRRVRRLRGRADADRSGRAQAQGR